MSEAPCIQRFATHVAKEKVPVTMLSETKYVQTDQNATSNPVLVSYQDQLIKLRGQLTVEQSTRLYSLIGAWVCVALAIIVVATALTHTTVPLVLAVLPTAVSLMLYRVYMSSGRRWKEVAQEIDYFERGTMRLNATWQGQGEAGMEFAREGHLYQSDLNILGKGSLFELLCTTRSVFGAERLAAYLLDPVEHEESKKRQEAIKELRDHNHLREQIHRLGDHRSDDSGVGSFANWFGMTPLVMHPVIRHLLLLSTIVCVVLGLGIFSKALLWSQWMPLLLIVIVAQTSVAGLLFNKIRPRLRQLRLLTNSFTVLHGGLSLMETQKFESPKLQELTKRIQSTHASAEVRKIERLARFLDQREKLELYAISLLLVVATQLVLAMENWRRTNQNNFMGWVDAWAEFEALQALAGYAFEQTCTVFPELVEGTARFEAKQLGHPLLDAARCVCNDVDLDIQSRFYLVSGSNMAGKSTFLRSIGLNAVIALAGGPVRAVSASLSQLTVCASLAITDSLLDGRSRFLAEVERLGAMIASNQSDKPILFLIDEVFSGTNSQDRKAAAESVIDRLLENGAIGAISTHDLALAEIAEDTKRAGILVHMESRNPEDPLDFDYLVRPGIATRSNAMAIVRMIALVKVRSIQEKSRKPY
jgi:hypothetical protein